MTDLNTASVVQTLENMIAEKDALSAKELELLSSLKQALNRLGYDLLPLEPEPEPPAPHRRGRKTAETLSDEPEAETTAKRRRGRPRKNSLLDSPSLPDREILPNGSEGFDSELRRNIGDLPVETEAVYEKN